MLIKLNEFIEFQNTEASKKAIEKESIKDLTIRFAKVKSGKRYYVVTTLSRPLVNEMMRHNLERFKFFINPKTREIVIRYDNSSSCHNLELYKLQKIGKQFIDKFITYTMMPFIDGSGKYPSSIIAHMIQD